jgi:hypothetical protein
MQPFRRKKLFGELSTIQSLLDIYHYVKNNSLAYLYGNIDATCSNA